MPGSSPASGQARWGTGTVVRCRRVAPRFEAELRDGLAAIKSGPRTLRFIKAAPSYGEFGSAISLTLSFSREPGRREGDDSQGGFLQTGQGRHGRWQKKSWQKKMKNRWERNSLSILPLGKEGPMIGLFLPPFFCQKDWRFGLKLTTRPEARGSIPLSQFLCHVARSSRSS